MIVMERESANKLLELPVNQTLRLEIDDRVFVILDHEEFLRILAMANMGCIDVKC